MEVQYFKITKYTDITIDFYSIHDGSIIQCMRTPHTLLSMEFYPSRHKIYINAYMNGEPMKKAISIDSPLHIQDCRIKYNHRTSRCDIYQNQKTTPHTFRIQDFKYNMIVAIQCGVNINENTGNSNTHNVDRFLDQTKHLTGFQDMVRILDGGMIHMESFKKKVNQYNKIALREHSNCHKDIRSHINTFYSKEMTALNKNTNSQPSNSDIIVKWPITMVCMKNKEKICLYKNGEYKELNESTVVATGYWKSWKTQLWVSKKGTLIQMRPLEKESICIDSIRTRWLWSGNISVNDFLHTTHQSNEIIILIITCIKKLPQAKQQQETWIRDLQSIGIRCLFVAGDPTLKYPELTNNFLLLPCEDDYEHLPKKVFYALQFIYKHYTFQHVYKLDDDAYVNPIYFMYMDKILNGVDYMGRKKVVGADFNRFWHKGKCGSSKWNKLPYPENRIHTGVEYARGEAGYFLSCRAIKLLLPYQDYIISDLYEDKVIGDCLAREGVRPHDNEIYKTKLYEPFHKDRTLDQYGLIVDVSIDKMRVLYRNHFKNKMVIL